jgi:hypothetical protein
MGGMDIGARPLEKIGCFGFVLPKRRLHILK